MSTVGRCGKVWKGVGRCGKVWKLTLVVPSTYAAPGHVVESVRPAEAVAAVVGRRPLVEGPRQHRPDLGADRGPHLRQAATEDLNIPAMTIHTLLTPKRRGRYHFRPNYVGNEPRQ